MLSRRTLRMVGSGLGSAAAAGGVGRGSADVAGLGLVEGLAAGAAAAAALAADWPACSACSGLKRRIGLTIFMGTKRGGPAAAGFSVESRVICSKLHTI